ncbi:MAG: DedA family protein [Thermodesulfovibrionales bacterium]|nr:DedA family protein [Thermodesulfovibrionales bacterium]
MEYLIQFIDIFIHLDKHLSVIIERYGLLTYIILFVIVFLETGVVITPFLPGDSLLFAAGTFASLGSLNLYTLYALLTIAAILGDTVNYWIGWYVGPKVFHRDDVRFLNKKHLIRTHEFYEKYGGKTIIIARFVPIIRTFAPFVAGIGSMSYSKFILYNITGAILWVGVCVTAGYLFGNLPIVKNNFSLVILAIILLSISPAIVEFIKHKMRSASQ